MKNQSTVQRGTKISMKKLTQVVANKSVERNANVAEPTDVEHSQQIARDAKLAELKRLLSDVTSRDVIGRYKFGLVVVDVKNDPKKYGKEAVKQLAEELGLEKSTAYDHANVAEMWPAKEFAKLCERRTTKGMPISFSHLVELIGVKSAKRRTRLLDTVVEQSLSVRGLRELIAGGSGDVSKPSASTSDSGANERSLADFVSAVDASLEIQKHWQVELTAMCRGPSTRALAQQIAAAKVKLEAQRDAADNAIKLLEIEERRVEAELTKLGVAVSTPESRPNQTA